MHLAQVGLVRIVGHPRAVLHSRAKMRVVLDTEAGEQTDAILHLLTKCMSRATADGDDDSGHDKGLAE